MSLTAHKKIKSEFEVLIYFILRTLTIIIISDLGTKPAGEISYYPQTKVPTAMKGKAGIGKI